jgi:hypothetical protein
MAAVRSVDDWSDALLPTQIDTLAALADRAPERRLLAAVLLDAVLHLSRGGGKRAAEAERWIRARNAECMPCSFGMVCDSLGLNAEYLARMLLDRGANATFGGSIPRCHARSRGEHRRQITLVRPRRRRAAVPMAG